MSDLNGEAHTIQVRVSEQCARYNGHTHIYKGGCMKRAEFVARIAEKAELSKAQTEKVFSCFIEETIEILKAGGRISIVGFGVFSTVTRIARNGVNPRTGKLIRISAKTNGKFTPGKALKNLDAQAAVQKKAAKKK